MRKIGGFRLGRNLVKIFKWVTSTHPTRKSRTKRQRLNLRLNQNHATKCSSGAVTKPWNWVRTLKKGARLFHFSKAMSGYFRVGQKDPVDNTKQMDVPKGHLAVYVGEKDEGVLRILVPVIYFNHPLFGDLLREAEKVYGFDQPGGIQIPCRISEFENVQTRIAATRAGDYSRVQPSWSSRQMDY